MNWKEFFKPTIGKVALLVLFMFIPMGTICYDGLDVDHQMLMDLCGVTWDEYDFDVCPEGSAAIRPVGGCYNHYVGNIFLELVEDTISIKDVGTKVSGVIDLVILFSILYVPSCIVAYLYNMFKQSKKRVKK